MKPYTPPTNRGRQVAQDYIHHATQDAPSYRNAAAKTQRHAARQHAQKEIKQGALEHAEVDQASESQASHV